MTKRPYNIYIPSVRKSNGTGHLRRCLEWMKKDDESCLLLNTSEDTVDFDTVINQYSEISDRIIRELPPSTEIRCLILDQRVSDTALLDSLPDNVPLIGLDEGGVCRNRFPYLLKILPSDINSGFNEVRYDFLHFPENRKSHPVLHKQQINKVLITFGGEDFGKSGEKVLHRLGDYFNENKWEVSVTDQRLASLGINYKDHPLDLKNHLYEFDLVITHYGLTALEASWAGCAVVLINPTKVHRTLAETEGFTHLNSSDIKVPVFDRALDNLKIPGIVSPGEIKGTGKGSFTSDGEICFSRICRCCGSANISVYSRHPGKTYYLCNDCRGLSLQTFFMDPETYNADYFSDEYKAQYGKTYLEDFNQIKNLSKTRVQTLRDMGGGQLSVLDVGCAYGPFLKALEELGIDCMGVDISEAAVNYVVHNLNIPSAQCDFEKTDVTDIPFNGRFNTITFWFVTEHFKQFDKILEKVNLSLPINGIFSFSTPNGSGISARKNRLKFLSHSPDDHFTVINRRTARFLLEKYGFKIEKTIVRGIHTERFPGILKFLNKNLLIKTAEKLFLGDTFEVYARKIREL